MKLNKKAAPAGGRKENKMDYKHCCVVNADGVYQTFVLVLLEQNEEGETTENVQGYKLAEGEQLIDAALPAMRQHAGTSGFIRPKWDEDTEAWIEAATAEQIAAWETEHPDPVSLEEKRAAKIAEMSAACNAAINAGTTVQMPDGTQEAFTYSTADQANVSEMFMACLMGAESYPYHANDEACKSYTAAEIMAIYGTLSMYKTGQLTYHNQLKQYINALETAQEVQAVTYGQELTGEYLVAYGTLMQEAQAQMQAVISKVGGANAGG